MTMCLSRAAAFLVVLQRWRVAAARTEVSAVEWEHFGLVNELRAEGFTCPEGNTYTPNSQPLFFDCRLWKASYLHSDDMAQNNYFAHNSQDGRSPWQRAEAQGISASAENIAKGQSTAAAVLNSWKNSDGHCNNMMNPNNEAFAVGHAADGNLWTQMYKRSNETDTSCHPQVDEPNGATSRAGPAPGSLAALVLNAVCVAVAAV
jgi:uncharacterized protein YkwD